jgi:hypothetical protein
MAFCTMHFSAIFFPSLINFFNYVGLEKNEEQNQQIIEEQLYGYEKLMKDLW